MTARAKAIWAFAITAVALFMITHDSLVVITALPVIKLDLGASLARAWEFRGPFGRGW